MPKQDEQRPSSVEPRFLTLEDVATYLSVSVPQVYALVRSGDLPAIKIGGRGQWRVEVDELERFIQQKYAEARAGVVPAEPADAPADDAEVSSGGTPRS